jgi:ribulose-5-phosphate 4-epimerase/fuculose-1-phosphate aldolase
MNSNRQLFSRVRGSDLLLLNAQDRTTMSRPDAPDPTAWGLHGAIRRHLPRAKCLMHVHTRYATALACLADPMLPPINQSAAEFFGRVVVDDAYGGLALEGEGERCARLLGDDDIQIMIMGNHGLLVIGETVAEAFDRMYYFERAAMTYIDVLHTGRPLNILSDEIAAKTAAEFRNYGASLAALHFEQLRAVLDDEGSNYDA